MIAIVLSCDRYRAVTEHMILQYETLWPDHPFLFRIPYQELYAPDTARREYRPCPVDIKGTMLELLRDLGDEDWIYWCSDDKYPVALDVPRIAALSRALSHAPIASVSGVLFCRCRHLLDRNFLTGARIHDHDGFVYLRRKDYSQIWIHQFLRVKVLRHLFERFPDVIERPKDMDRLKSAIALPASHPLFVTAHCLAVFGESTSRGYLTANCYRSMVDSGLVVSGALPVDSAKYILMGVIDREGMPGRVARTMRRLMGRVAVRG